MPSLQISEKLITQRKKQRIILNLLRPLIRDLETQINTDDAKHIYQKDLLNFPIIPLTKRNRNAKLGCSKIYNSSSTLITKRSNACNCTSMLHFMISKYHLDLKQKKFSKL